MIVAFLQNAWARDPHRLKAMFKRQGELYRRAMLRHLLFRGCLTGYRLRLAFGEAVCAEIVWEETTREIAGDARTILPAQPDHIKAVLAEVKPRVVLTFGKIAAAAVAPLWTGKLIVAPHPAARQPGTMELLHITAANLALTVDSMEAA